MAVTSQMAHFGFEEKCIDGGTNASFFNSAHWCRRDKRKKVMKSSPTSSFEWFHVLFREGQTLGHLRSEKVKFTQNRRLPLKIGDIRMIVWHI